MRTDPSHTHSKTALIRIRHGAPFLLLVALFLFSGCGEEQKKEAQGLVKAGSTSAENLQTYYTRLAQTRRDYFAFYRFDQARTGTPVKPELEAAFKEQEEALDARAAMAGKLKGLYDALGDLIDYDAPSEISTAAMDLKGEVEGVANKKLSVAGIGAADTTAILTEAISALVALAQAREFKKNSSRPKVVLDGIIHLFEAEKRIYEQIIQDYEKETRSIAEYVTKQGYAFGWSTMKKALDRYDLQVSSVTPANSTLNDWVLDNLRRRSKQLERQSLQETESQLEGLRALRKRHDDFLAGKRVEKDSQ